MIYGALITKTSPSIVIKINPETEEFEFIVALNNTTEDNLKEELYEFYTRTCSESTFINLPIVPIIGKLFENEKVFNHCFDYGFFNTQEKQLLEAVRNKECEEIKIIKHKSGDYTVNFSDAKEITGEEARKLRRTLGLKMYDRVEVIYRNDKTLHCLDLSIYFFWLIEVTMEPEKAKQILKEAKAKQHTDDEIKEILKFLTVLAKISIDNLLKTNKDG